MDTYTIEDIEMLREKGGLSYQEAVAMLEYHNGSLARALIDLEKNGRLKSEKVIQNGREENAKMSETEIKNDTKVKALNFLQTLYRSRLKIHKDNIPIVNLSVIFAAACLLFAPHLTIIGITLSMILGYKFSFTKMDDAFAADNLEKMVKSAAQNAKSSVSNVVQSITREKSNTSQIKNDSDKKDKTFNNQQEMSSNNQTSEETYNAKETVENLKQQTKQIEETMDSFFESNPAATSFHNAYSAAASSVPTLQVPVQTETRDGEVQIEDDQDGYSSVTIG